MDQNETQKQEINEKKGKRRGLTITGYLLVIIGLLCILPVILPPIFGYHTYLLGSDSTGLISKYGSVVYVKEIDETSYDNGNIVAIEAASGKNRRVDVSYVDSNASETLSLRTGETASYDAIVGRVVAKTPFIGYLSQLCFSVVGIIVIVLLFAAGIALMMYVNKISKEINQLVEDQKE